ncbi:MAG: tetratricopeptide repeat protein [Burkholderiaceae bacterium]|nr:tetratricopeptide repeat protein [Burkholderiaceae bacterium]
MSPGPFSRASGWTWTRRSAAPRPHCKPCRCRPRARRRWWNCSRSRCGGGRLDEASAHLAQARDIDPDVPTLWLDAAKLAHAQGDAAACAEATARYVQWLRRQPPGADLAGALTSQGVALDVAGRHADARPLHEEALAIARRISARYTELEAAGNLVFCLGELGRDADAARAGLRALAGADEVFNAPLASNTAYSLLAIGRLDEAERLYRRVLAGDNASAACAASGKLLEIAARRGAGEAALGAATDAVFAAIARTEVYSVQAGALVAVLNHGRAADARRVLPCLRDEPLYPGLQQRLDEALARHASAAT